MTWAEPDASMKAAVAGVGPNMKGDVPCNRAELLPHVGDAGVEGSLRTEPQGKLQPGGAEVDGDDLSWPRSTRVAMAASPMGPHPNTATPVAGLHVSLVGGAHPDGQRLGECRHVEREVVGTR